MADPQKPIRDSDWKDPEWDWFREREPAEPVAQPAIEPDLFDPPISSFATQSWYADAAQGLASTADNPKLDSDWAWFRNIQPIAPELVASIVQTGLGTEDEIRQELLGAFDAQNDAEVGETKLVAQFLAQYGDTLDEETRPLLLTAFALTPAQDRQKLASLLFAWAEGAWPAQHPDDFLTFAYDQASKLKEYRESRGSWFGKLGHVVGAPYRAVSGAISDVWALAVDPDDAAWRRNLSPGQNFALSIGMTPNEQSWKTISGLVDVLSNIGLDPLGLTFNIGRGAKLAKTFAMEVRPSIKMVVPLIGRKTVPSVIPRGVGTRIGWSLRGKAVNQLTSAIPDAHIDKIRLSLKEGVADFTTKYPELNEQLYTTFSPFVGKDTWDPLRNGVTRPITNEDIRKAIEISVVPEVASQRAQDLAVEVVNIAIRRDMALNSMPLLEQRLINLGVETPQDLQYVYKIGNNRRITKVKPAATTVDDQIVIFTSKPKIANLADRSVMGDLLGEAYKEGKEDLVNKIVRSETITARDRMVIADLLPKYHGFNLKGRVYLGRNPQDAMITPGGFPELSQYRGNFDLIRRLRARERGMNTELGWIDNVDRLIVSNLRTAPKRNIPLTSLWRGLASNDEPGYWARWRRMMTAKMFSPAPIEGFADYSDPVKGADNLRRSLRHLGENRSSIKQALEEWFEADPIMRHETYERIMQRVSQNTGNPTLAVGLARHAHRFDPGVVSYGKNAAGEELLTYTTSSGRRVAAPIHEFQFRQGFVMPSRTWKQQADRFAFAKRVPGWLTRGLGKTSRTRRNLAQSLKEQAVGQLMHDKGISKVAAARELQIYTPDDWLAAAYAGVVDDAGELILGPGNLAKLRGVMGTGFDALNRIFTVSQLFLRIIPYATRLLFDEHARGALMDGISLFSSPAKYAANVMDTYRLNQISKIKKRILDAEGGVARKNLLGLYRDDSRNMLRLQQRLADLKRLTKLRLGPTVGLADDANIFEHLGVNVTKPDDIVDLKNKDMSQLLATATSPTAKISIWTPQMTAQGRRAHTVALGQALFERVWQPTFRAGLLRMAAGTGDEKLLEVLGKNMDSVSTLLTSRMWREQAKLIARAREGATEGMAEWALENVYVPEAENLLMPLFEAFGRDNVLRGLIDDTMGWVGLANRDDAITFVNRIVSKLEGYPNVTMPREIVVQPNRMWAQFGSGVKKPSMVHRALHFVSEDLSQALHRQPTWLAKYKDYREFYTGLGWAADKADKAASIRATEIVNNIFYNSDALTPGLTYIGRRGVPFFAALWEVGQTWFYKIPFLETNPIAGYAHLIRQIDRVLSGAQAMGLLEFQPAPDAQFAQQARLVLPEHPDTGNFFSQLASSISEGDIGVAAGTVLRKGFTLPGEALGHALNAMIQTRNLLFEDDWGLIDAESKRDTMVVSIGNPIDPFTGGFGATSQAHFGSSPVHGWLLDKLRKKLPIVNDNKRHKIEGEVTLGALADELEVAPAQIVGYNLEVFREHFNQTTIDSIRQGKLDADTIVLPEGAVLVTPHTSIAGQFLNNFLFPFDLNDSAPGVALNYMNAGFRHILNAFALNRVNPEGGFRGGEGGWVGAYYAALSEMGQSQLDGELISAMQHLEARHGWLTAARQAQERLEEFERSVPADLTLENLSPEMEATFYRLKADVEDTNKRLGDAVSELAWGSSLWRGLLGLTMPAIPRTVWTEAEETANYYSSKEFAENLIAGDPFAAGEPIPTNITDIKEFRELVGSWAAAKDGSQAKKTFLSHHPALLPMLRGKSYWAAGGEPPPIKAFDQWAEQITGREREVFSPDVYHAAVNRGAVSYEREVAIDQAFGQGAEAAIAILSHYRKFRELSELYSIRFDILDTVDIESNGGAYQAWAKRGEAGYPTLLNAADTNVQRTLDEIDGTLDELDNFDVLSSVDRREIRGQLGGITRALHNAFSSRNDVLRSNGGEDDARSRLMEKWFEEYMGPTSEKITALYDSLDVAVTDSERAKTRLAIAEFEDTEGLKPVVIDGVQFPNYYDYRWGAMNDEEKKRWALRRLGSKPEWLSSVAARRIVSQFPDMKEQIPFDRSLYRKVERTRARIVAMSEINPETGTSELSIGESRKAYERLKEQYTQILVSEGRTAELEYLEAYPIERLAQANVLSPSLASIASKASTVHRFLDSQDKSSQSDLGRSTLGVLYQEMYQLVQTDPAAHEEVATLGMEMFDSQSFSEIFEKLVNQQ